jgi:hypothetical protein
MNTIIRVWIAGLVPYAHRQATSVVSTLPLLALLTLTAAAPVPRFALVTPAEASASAAAHATDAPAIKSLNPFAPRIDVVQPVMARPLANPFDVVVRFTPQGDAALDPKSLKIRYGFFRVDVTARLLGAARWQGNEISASGAEAPKGTHHFYVQIADSRNRVAETDMIVVVR